MFEKFSSVFNTTLLEPKEKLSAEHKNIFSKSFGAVEFMNTFEGQSFKDGLYRVHKTSELNKWTQIVYEAFPAFRNKVFCFSYDWLGRHFAIDFSRLNNGEPEILMFEVGTGKALEIPSTFLSFHDEELVEYSDAALASDFYYEWKNVNSDPIEHNQCVGYKVPLFLGGEDEISNLELSDMEVYWGIFGQLMKQIL